MSVGSSSCAWLSGRHEKEVDTQARSDDRKKEWRPHFFLFLSVMFSCECVALAFLVGRGKWSQNFPRGKGGAHPRTAATSRNSMILSIFENATIDVN